MKYYVIYNSEGNVKELFAIEDSSFLHSPKETSALLEVDEVTYEQLKGRGAHYHVKDNKVKKKNQTEIDEVETVKKNWRLNNTIPGLREQIEELKRGKSDTKQ